MVDRTSALDKNYEIVKKINDENVNLIFNRNINLQITQVAAWPDTVSKVELIISKYLKILSLPGSNFAEDNDSFTIMRVEPLKWWILNSDIPLLSTEEGTTLDLSHSFTNIQISGPSAKLFLNRFLPLDLRDNSFPINKVASSAIHHVSVKLWLSRNGFQLFIPRGYAMSLWEIFQETATQFGYEIK